MDDLRFKSQYRQALLDNFYRGFIFPPSSPFYGKNALLVRLSGSFSRLDTFHNKTCTSLEINEVILCQPTLRTYYLEKKSIDLVPVELNFQKAKR